MKRTLLLAGCLLLCAGCAKKKPQVTGIPVNNGTRSWEGKAVCSSPTGWVPCAPTLTIHAEPLPDQDGGEVDFCADKEVSCGAWPQPMVAPTMHDVVTHSQELSCPKGYSEKHLLLGDAIPQNWQEVFSDEYLVCVKPSFIAELKRANGEQK